MADQMVSFPTGSKKLETIGLKRSSRWRSILTHQTFRVAMIGAGMFVIFVAVFAWIQFSTPDLPDNDGYYHIKLASLMWAEGFKPDFPWLPLTILNPREFYDHHFLFHVVLIPFTFGDLRLGAKWASVIFASLAFLSAWWLMRSQRLPYAELWAVGLLAVSSGFLYRLSITRAQSLSLALLMAGLYWMFTQRYWLLLPLAFVYVWSYDAFPLLGIVALVYGVGVWLVERRVEWKPVAYVAVGVVLGLLINPYFPNDLIFVYRHLLPKLVGMTEVRVGIEWYPYSTTQLIENSMFGLIAFAAGILGVGLSEKRMDTRTAVAFLLSLVFGVMLMQARRFVEYFPAFALLFAAFAWAPALEHWRQERNTPERQTIRISPRWYSPLQRWLPLMILVLFTAAGMMQTLPDVRQAMRGSKPYDLYAAASTWLAANTAPGERVFQTDWDDFPRLFFYNTHNTYLIGLDPTYMQIYDPEKYDLWVRITQGKVKNPAKTILGSFGARYVISDLNHEDFIVRARADTGLEEVYRDDQAVIYRVNSTQP